MTNQSTRTPAAPATRERPVFAPRTDIYESEGSVVLVADMPGVDDQSVEVTLEDDVLTIVGHTQDAAPAGYKRIYAEFEQGDYRRSFVLSERADAAAIQASVKNGVLRVEVPKVKPAQRRIQVSSGTS
ncbi:MAG TPA: Hsp20/alpha crystallin family protein [Planctomycetota bacterium]|jgi:HSP20 family molecular chaperone IbpA|nr:Hsp20/alpha crystallin family protein [Planctomycetota bacterium]